jgi:hypothetical protein
MGGRGTLSPSEPVTKGVKTFTVQVLFPLPMLLRQHLNASF